MKRNPFLIHKYGDLAPYSECNPRELGLVDGLTSVVTVAPGTVLARQGSRVHQYVVIVDGTAEEESDGHFVGHLEHGDDFGGSGIVGNLPHAATVVAATPMTLQVVGEREFRAAFADIPSLREHVNGETARAVRRWAPAACTPEPLHADARMSYTLAS
jgi:CRP-like cAMP-binding protein